MKPCPALFVIDPVSLAFVEATDVDILAQPCVAELRAALLNESGRGDPPSPGWCWIDPDLEPYWSRSGAFIDRPAVDGWCWKLDADETVTGTAPTAREAMRAADAALAARRAT